MLKKLWRSEKGFTLMEIVIVIVILGILALLAIPRLLGFTDQAEIANDKEYAAVIGRAAELYWASHDEQILVTSGSSVYATLLGANLFDAKENTLQYYDTSATVTVDVSDGTDSQGGVGGGTLDKGIALVSIAGNHDGSGATTLIYSSQYGYTQLP